jgi:hypothetical protein
LVLSINACDIILEPQTAEFKIGLLFNGM